MLSRCFKHTSYRNDTLSASRKRKFKRATMSHGIPSVESNASRQRLRRSLSTCALNACLLSLLIFLILAHRSLSACLPIPSHSRRSHFLDLPVSSPYPILSFQFSIHHPKSPANVNPHGWVEQTTHPRWKALPIARAKAQPSAVHKLNTEVLVREAANPWVLQDRVTKEDQASGTPLWTDLAHPLLLQGLFILDFLWLDLHLDKCSQLSLSMVSLPQQQVAPLLPALHH